MTAKELYDEGKLGEAIDAQIEYVKEKPTDHTGRFFLFELLLFVGELEWGRRQLDAIRSDQPEVELALERYRKALDAEATRRKVLTGQTRPKFLIDVPIQAKQRLDALTRYSRGAAAAGDHLLDRANVDSPAVMGLLNGEMVDGLRDFDDLLGPNLEVIAGREYCWIPLDQVESLTLNPVKFPRDLVWRQANLAVRHGPHGDVLLPALYFGSHASQDEAIQLGRATQWNTHKSGPARGLGRRVFHIGEKWVPFVDWQTFLGKPQSRC
jgi:type VI secretion system protein ImpE